MANHDCYFKYLAFASSDYLPKREHLQDLRDYIRALVERYDGDGQDDMRLTLTEYPVLIEASEPAGKSP